ncbi:MAG: ABC transporter ATP-binding protein [Candidatus Coatesbacteria bacterium]|nr:ABC transporter ATP-binding protein [Candidatus Coatesbacteria bacterium]
MTEKIFKINNLIKKYPEFTLGPLDIELNEGEVTGYIGQNAAGKTTTIRCLTGLSKIDSGSIKIFDKDTENFRCDMKEKIGIIYEQQMFYENMKAGWNLKTISSFFKNWDTKIENHLIELFKINRNQKVSDLSRGTRVKLAFLVALSHKPELLIMDEPTSGLDPIVRDDILEFLARYKTDNKCSVFFSSHIISDLEKIADTIIFLKEGRIICKESKSDIIRNWKIFSFSSVVEQLKKDTATVSWRLSDAKFTVISKDEKSTFSTLSSLDVKPAEVIETNLENLTIEILKGNGNI